MIFDPEYDCYRTPIFHRSKEHRIGKRSDCYRRSESWSSMINNTDYKIRGQYEQGFHIFKSQEDLLRWFEIICFPRGDRSSFIAVEVRYEGAHTEGLNEDTPVPAVVARYMTILRAAPLTNLRLGEPPFKEDGVPRGVPRRVATDGHGDPTGADDE
jgi:hypothetical protein